MSLQGLLLKIQDDPIWNTTKRPQEDTLKQDIEKATGTCQSLKSRRDRIVLLSLASGGALVKLPPEKTGDCHKRHPRSHLQSMAF